MGNSSGGDRSSLNDKTTVKDDYDSEEKIIAEESEVIFRYESFKDDNIKNSRLNLVDFKCAMNSSVLEQGAAVIRAHGHKCSWIEQCYEH